MPQLCFYFPQHKTQKSESIKDTSIQDFIFICKSTQDRQSRNSLDFGTFIKILVNSCRLQLVIPLWKVMFPKSKLSFQGGTYVSKLICVSNLFIVFLSYFSKLTLTLHLIVLISEILSKKNRFIPVWKEFENISTSGDRRLDLI